MRALLILCLTGLLLSACGQKGPLYLPPEPEVAAQPADGTSPAPVSDSQEEDAETDPANNTNQPN